MKPKRPINLVLKESFLKPYLTKNLKSFFPGAKKITFFYSKYLRFLSEESFLVRYEIDLLMKNGVTVTKVLRGNRVPPQTFTVMNYFYTRFKQRHKNIIARPLAYFDELGFILYEEYSGWVLREFDHQLDVLKKTVPIIARQLASLHNASPDFGSIRTADDEVKYFAVLRQKIGRFFPSIKKRFDRYARTYLKQLTAKVDEKTFVLNHGDFQSSNIIYDLRTGRIGFIDFTSAARTSPANDVATFLTHSRAMLCYLFPKSKVDRLERLFLKRYFTAVNKKIAQTVKKDLPIYQTRISLDIITTTAVFTKYNKSPYYMTIINEMLKRAQQNLLGN